MFCSQSRSSKKGGLFSSLEEPEIFHKVISLNLHIYHLCSMNTKMDLWWISEYHLHCNSLKVYTNRCNESTVEWRSLKCLMWMLVWFVMLDIKWTKALCHLLQNKPQTIVQMHTVVTTLANIIKVMFLTNWIPNVQFIQQ